LPANLLHLGVPQAELGFPQAQGVAPDDRVVQPPVAGQ
jgi:hypothetical protein